MTKYCYDAVGNRLSQTINGETTHYTYDDNDRVESAGLDTYLYDDNGNTITALLETGTLEYRYNSKNQLIEADSENGIIGYAYNVDGIRTEAGETRFVVDGNRAYAQVLVEDNPTIDTVYSYGDDLISQSRNGTSYFYHYDGLGSTRSLSDQSGTITDTYDYQAFGELLDQSGTTENRYLYTGEQFDEGLDQYYLRARYYDQGIGRFTSMDTWQGNNFDPVTLHKYLYANADPVHYRDPTGNFSLTSVSIGSTISGILTTTSIAATGYELYGYASGDRELNARNVGWTVVILASGPIAGKAIKGIAAARAIRAAETALKSGQAGKLFLNGPKTSEVILKRFIPSDAQNLFKPSSTIKAGFKYQFKVGSTKVEIKWHSPDLKAAEKFPGSNSGSMWTAQIKIGKKLLGTDGKMHNKPSNETHIPIDIF